MFPFDFFEDQLTSMESFDQECYVKVISIDHDIWTFW